MDGDAVEKIASLARENGIPHLIDGKTYSTVPMYEVKPVKEKVPALTFTAPPVLELTTLTSLVDYLAGNPDGIAAGETFGRYVPDRELPVGARIIHVKSPTCVEIVSAYQRDDTNSRIVFARAQVQRPAFPFSQPIPREEFMVALLARFDKSDGDDLEYTLGIVGNVIEEQALGQQDNGHTQTVTARAGIVNKESVPVKNPVNLALRRSFPEVPAAVAPFVIRLNPGMSAGKPMTVTLHECDGGMWAVDTATAIQRWLTRSLGANNNLLIVR